MRRLVALAVALAPLSALAQTIVYLNANLASGADDGSSWASAYRGPQALKRAMDLTPALSNSQIWVAQGRYTPAPPDGDRRAHFPMKSAVAVYGGFAGAESSLSQRNPTAHPVILSADLNNNDESRHTEENSIHLVQAVSTDTSAILDGVTIQGGYAWGLIAGFAINDRFGANILIDDSDAVFANCTISDTFASEGGGVHLDGESNPTFTNCAFTRNTAQNTGGGVHVASGSSGRFVHCEFTANVGGLGGAVFNGRLIGVAAPATPVFEDCRFVDNVGEIGGGNGPGAFDASAATFIRCEFLRNRCPSGGGGIFCGGSGTTVISCSFAQNEGSFDGGDAIRVESGVNRITNCLFFAHGDPGGMRPSGITAWITGGRTEFINCTFANNNLGFATPSFGHTALFFGPGATPTTGVVDNCVFWNNRSQSGFTQSASLRVQSGTVTVNHSLVQGWTGSLPGAGSFAANPLFVDIDGLDGVAGTPDDDLRLSAASPAIDAAHNAPLIAALASAPTLLFADLAGAPRFVDDAFTPDTGPGTPPLADRGAFEFQPACRADLSADGLVDFSDYLAFLNFFDAADLRADFTADGLVDFADYLEFLNLFDAGC